jgi:glycosyltransferase involved in cell wall biosynthesis
MTAKARISIIIPARNEEKYIEECVKSVLSNASRDFDIEVIVVDGLSDDKTAVIVRSLAAGGAPVTVIENPRRITPASLNLGIRAARGDFYIFLGAHASIPANYVERCLAVIKEHEEAWCVGGFIETFSDARVGQCIADAMSSPFGVGNARFRTGEYRGYVDTLTFGMYRSWVFDKIGDFDESLVRNQDDDLNLRILEAGGKIYMDPSISSKYTSRSTIRNLFRQYFQYGFWRFITFAKHGKVASFRQLVPALFMLVMTIGVLLALFVASLRTPFLIFLSAYCLFLIAGAVDVSRRSSPRSGALAPLIFLVLHCSYGLGFWVGLLAHAIGLKDSGISTRLSR